MQIFPKITKAALRQQSFHRRLKESEQVVRAIASGEVDAFVVSTAQSEEVLLLGTADRPYRLLSDKMQQGGATISRDGTIRYANEHFSSMLGVPLHELIGSPMQAFVTDATRESLAKLLTHATGEVTRSELEFRRADGTTFVACGAAHPLPDELPAICLVVTDLTEVRRQEALAAEVALGRSILEQALEAIIACDMHGRVIRASRTARQLCNGDPESRPFASVYPLQCATTLPDVTSIIGGQVVRNVECSLPREHQEPAILLLSGGPVVDDRGRSLGCVITLTDVTELKRAEQELRQSDSRKDEILAIVAHELRNTLAPIRNVVDVFAMMQRRYPAIQEAQSILARQVDSLVKLVNDLVDVNRVRLGKLQIERARIDVRAVVERVVESVGPVIAAREQRLDVSIPALPVRIDGDLGRLSQALLNLLSNASKFSANGGTIRLSVEPAADRDQVVVTVEDAGVGIPLELLGRLFEPFIQGPTPEGRQQRGLGIGLALARQIVLAHDGSIEAYSEGPGSGSRFEIRLPRAAE